MLRYEWLILPQSFHYWIIAKGGVGFNIDS